jgi:hypothetical protein
MTSVCFHLMHLVQRMLNKVENNIKNSISLLWFYFNVYLWGRYNKFQDASFCTFVLGVIWRDLAHCTACAFDIWRRNLDFSIPLFETVIGSHMCSTMLLCLEISCCWTMLPFWNSLTTTPAHRYWHLAAQIYWSTYLCDIDCRWSLCVGSCDYMIQQFYVKQSLDSVCFVVATTSWLVQCLVCRILGPHSSGYEEFQLLGYNAV